MTQMSVPTELVDSKSRNRPSSDQSVGLLDHDDSNSTSSSPDPFDDFRYRSLTRLRFERKTTLDPSGAQIGDPSCAVSNVNRVCRALSTTQRSLVLVAASILDSATLDPSGASSRSLSS